MEKFNFNRLEKGPEGEGNKSPKTTPHQSSALQDNLDEDTSDDMKKIITTIKDSGKELFVVYRSNDIYDQLVPNITKTLEKHQIPFTAKVFPQGTDKDEIKQWVEAHRNEYLDKIFVSDYTCGYQQDHKDKTRNACTNYYLDSICDNSVEVFYKEKFSTELEFGINGFDKIFIDLLQQCLSHGHPEKIIIVKPGIGDHGTGDALQCTTTENMSELYNNGGMTGRAKYYEVQNEIRSDIANKLQEFVKKAGYTGEMIVADGNNNHEFDTEKNRFVYDRHMSGHNRSAAVPTKAKALVLPFTNLLSSMKQYNFLTDIPSHNDIKKYILQNIASGLPGK